MIPKTNNINYLDRSINDERIKNVMKLSLNIIGILDDENYSSKYCTIVCDENVSNENDNESEDDIINIPTKYFLDLETKYVTYNSSYSGTESYLTIRSADKYQNYKIKKIKKPLMICLEFVCRNDNYNTLDIFHIKYLTTEGPQITNELFSINFWGKDPFIPTGFFVINKSLFE